MNLFVYILIFIYVFIFSSQRDSPPRFKGRQKWFQSVDVLFKMTRAGVLYMIFLDIVENSATVNARK
jgi:hypothetical protein